MKEEKSWMIEMEKGFRGTAMMQNDKKITPDGQSSVCTDLSALFEDARAMNLTKRANEELGSLAGLHSSMARATSIPGGAVCAQP